MNFIKFSFTILAFIFSTLYAKADETYLDPFFKESFSNNSCDKIEVYDMASGYNFIINKDFRINNLIEFQSLGFRKIYSENSDSTIMGINHHDEKKHSYLVKFFWNESKTKLKKVESDWYVNISELVDPFESPDVYISILNDYVDKYKTGTNLKLSSEPSKEEINNFTKTNDQINYIFTKKCGENEINVVWRLYASKLNNSKVLIFNQTVTLIDVEDNKLLQQKEKERIANVAKKKKSLTKNDKNELIKEFNQLKSENRKINTEISVDQSLHKEKSEYYAENNLSKKLSSTANKSYLASLDEISTRVTKNTFKLKFNEKRINEILELMPELK